MVAGVNIRFDVLIRIVFEVGLTFGLMITVLAYLFGHTSGAQINPCVTVGTYLFREWNTAKI